VNCTEGYDQLYGSPPLRFLGMDLREKEPDYVILGVPFDGTTTYRPGSRFGPNAIREASMNIETVSLRAGKDIEALRILDQGDLDVSAELEETLRRLRLVTDRNTEQGRFQIVLGGEHSLTLGVVRSWGDRIGVLDFDAHMDLRDDYLGRRFSHATVMRRIIEEIGEDRIVQVGTRAVSGEELTFAQEKKIPFFTSHDIFKSGVASVAERILREIEGFEKIYLTVDVDVLDPAFAPAVGNPEPEGLSTTQLLDLLIRVIDERVIGMDLVEVTPPYDEGITAIQACRVVFEALCTIDDAKIR